jgi:hypothetical protein
MQARTDVIRLLRHPDPNATRDRRFSYSASTSRSYSGASDKKIQGNTLEYFSEIVMIRLKHSYVILLWTAGPTHLPSGPLFARNHQRC